MRITNVLPHRHESQRKHGRRADIHRAGSEEQRLVEKVQHSAEYQNVEEIGHERNDIDSRPA